MRDVLERGHRAGHAQVGGEEPVLDHRKDQGGRADLEVGGDLGEVRVAEDDVQAAVLLGIGVRFVPGVDDRALQRRLEPHLHLEVVGALADLEPVAVTVLPEPDPAGTADHLTADEERGQVTHDVAERCGPADEVVLVRAVGRPLVVGVVLVEQQVALAADRGEPTGVERDLLPRLVPPDDVERGRALRGGVLRVRVVDVEAGAVGEDHVRQAEVLVGELAGVGHLPRHVEPSRVAQR